MIIKKLTKMNWIFKDNNLRRFRERAQDVDFDNAEKGKNGSYYILMAIKAAFGI